ncbi:Cys-Cys-COOH (seleno)protein SaoC [Pelotomaculum propionicicum]|uniref:Cys-Cys-COOH (seleno)protein SaoC n=1 Tax=Pelotomaculum propionicicum TaxID=258475 RepID=UPI003B80388D
MFRRWLACGLLVCLVVGVMTAGCGKTAVIETKHSDKSEASETGEPSPCLSYFTLTHGGKEVIKCASADLDGDNIEDLVVIYRESEERNNMLVVLDKQGEYQCTNEVPAPVSNQVITFKDIDDKPPLEFIVQGMKGANVGYAIYRVEGTSLEDLFGEGMKDCC